MPDKPIESDAESIQEKYGEDADLYAETRSEAASQAGRKQDAKHWQRVAKEVDERRCANSKPD